MCALKRIVLVIVSTLIVLIAVGAPGGYWFITKSHPQIEGTSHVGGLQSRVEILRDPMGVPHIYAEKPDDLFFAQGYVQAQDRLWQMEYSRRAGQGTLSEIFGPATFKQDRLARMVGLNRAARADSRRCRCVDVDDDVDDSQDGPGEFLRRVESAGLVGRSGGTTQRA